MSLVLWVCCFFDKICFFSFKGMFNSKLFNCKIVSNSCCYNCNNDCNNSFGNNIYNYIISFIISISIYFYFSNNSNIRFIV